MSLLLDEASGAAQKAALSNEPDRIYDRYLPLSGPDSPEYAAARKEFVDRLLRVAFERIGSSPRDEKPLRAAMVVLGNLPLWRSCDTEADVRRIAAIIRQGDGTAPSPELRAEGYAAIRRAEGQLTELLRNEAASAADVEKSIARMVEISAWEELRDTEYLTLLESVLATKRQEAVFWYVPFDSSVAELWVKISDGLNCVAAAPCHHLRESSALLDRFLDTLKSFKTSPSDERYFLYNDYILLRAMNHIMAGELDAATNLLNSEILGDSRNAEAMWYDPTQPLDHIYVYKFFRDPDEVGGCRDVALVDGQRNRCPIKEFFNPVQFAEFLLGEISTLQDHATAQSLTIQSLDNRLRGFVNHDYRLVLEHFRSRPADGLIDSRVGRLPETRVTLTDLKKLLEVGGALPVPGTCPKRSEPVGDGGSVEPVLICLWKDEKSSGLYDGYFFVGGNLNASEGKRLIDMLRKMTKGIKPYLIRPYIKG